MLKSMLNCNTASTTIGDIEGCSTPIEVSERFNEFFSNIGADLAANIPNSLLELDLEPRPNTPLFELKNTTPDEVGKILKQMSSAKATGEDGVFV